MLTRAKSNETDEHPVGWRIRQSKHLSSLCVCLWFTTPRERETRVETLNQQAVPQVLLKTHRQRSSDLLPLSVQWSEEGLESVQSISL